MTEIVSNLIELYVFKKIHDEPKYLLLKRAADVVFPNIWQMISGTIENNEKAYETAFRELYEETGFKTDKLYVVPKISEFYYQQQDTVNLVPIFLAELNEDKITLSNEHVEYSWFDFVDAYQKLHWITWKDNLELINNIFKDEIKYKNLEKIFIN
ncbi:MAG: NUDIX domain-containing protein [Bacteroidetes bacterium]|nr:NUDIX domain-containing protein [Bacteroidota bacterium]